MGTTKDRSGMDLTEAEDIKKRWQEYWSGLPFPSPGTELARICCRWILYHSATREAQIPISKNQNKKK